MSSAMRAMAAAAALLVVSSPLSAQVEIRSLTGTIEGHEVGGVTIDMIGNVYAADFGDIVWRLTPEGQRTTFASGLFKNDRFYVTAFWSHAIYEVTLDRKVTRVLGNAERAIVDGAGADARLSFPMGIACHPWAPHVLCGLLKRKPLKYSGAQEATMRPTFFQLSSAILCMLLATPISAQQLPDFSGQWQREDRNDIGSGWGDVITVTQEGSRLQVEYALFVPSDRQPPLRFVYDLEGRETHNDFMMGRGVQMQTSRARLIGGSLEIMTSHELVVQGRPLQSEVRQVLSLESSATLVVEVTRLGVLGGPPTTSRSVYRRLAGR